MVYLKICNIYVVNRSFNKVLLLLNIAETQQDSEYAHSGVQREGLFVFSGDEGPSTYFNASIRVKFQTDFSHEEIGFHIRYKVLSSCMFYYLFPRTLNI